jgi:hypothetical protein
MRGLLAGAAVSARSTTAMRMATPFRTCSRIARLRMAVGLFHTDRPVQ